MKKETLLSPRFTGDRFASHSLPLSLLKDLEALQGIVLEIARAEFIKANPNRRRTPRGFSESLTLHLVGVSDGSFVAEVGLVDDGATLPGLSAERGLAKAACERLLEAIGHAQDQTPGPAPVMSDATWAHLDRFGRGLRDGEAIEFGSQGGRVIRLTKETRRRLLLARPGAQAVTDEVDLVGRLGDVRPTERALSLLLAGEQSVLASVTEAQVRELNDVRVGDFGAVWLRVTGVGLFDRDQKIQRLDEVQSIERLDASDPRVRLDKLKELGDGWLDGRGVALDRPLLQRVAVWFDEQLDEGLPLPRIYPTPEGGVEAEWLVGRLDVSVEFDPRTELAELHAMDLDTDKVEEQTARYDDPEAMRALGEILVTVLSGGAGTEAER